MTADITHIWELVLSGDHRAWSRLVGLYSGLIFNVAGRIGLKGADAEDCAQQTWMSLYKNRRSIKDPTALPAWLIRTTHRNGLRMLKRQYRSDLTDSQEIDRSRLPDHIVEQIELESVIAFALERLDPRCRILLHHLFFDKQSLSYSQLAATLGVKPNSLGPLRGRCLKKLRQIIEEMGYELD